MKSSTRAFWRLHGWRHPLRFLHGYLYGRWTRAYVALLRLGSSSAPRGKEPGPLARWLERTYHSKVLRREEAEKIIRLDRPLRVAEPERVVPFETANSIVLDTPGELAVLPCPCRESRGEEGCRPREVCLVVGAPFVPFLLEHPSSGARRVSREEALGVLRDTDRRGWVHTAWFKGAMGGRFYAICNCCSCCCLGLQGMRNSGYRSRYLLPSGYVARVDQERCNGCGLCRGRCPFQAVRTEGERPWVDPERCFGCGVCRSLCPREAVTLVREPSRGLPLDPEALAPELPPP